MEFLRDIRDMLEKEEGTIFVYQGEVMSADRLNEIEHFDDESLITYYVRVLMQRRLTAQQSETDSHPFIELGRGKYVAHFHIQYEHLLTVIWYDDQLYASKPLKEIIEKITKKIDYMKHCRTVDVEDF